MQGDLFTSLETPKPAAVVRADPAKVRVKLLAVLEEARAATSVPWNDHDTRYWRLVFPQMSRWLPEAERAELIEAFQKELKRLGID